jgi:hypothetical protein
MFLFFIAIPCSAPEDRESFPYQSSCFFKISWITKHKFISYSADNLKYFSFWVHREVSFKKYRHELRRRDGFLKLFLDGHSWSPPNMPSFFLKNFVQVQGK